MIYLYTRIYTKYTDYNLCSTTINKMQKISCFTEIAL